MTDRLILVIRNPESIPNGLRVVESLYFLEAIAPLTEQELRSLASSTGLKIVAIETWNRKGGYIFARRENGNDSE
jgi:hypothetical protein